MTDKIDKVPKSGDKRLANLTGGSRKGIPNKTTQAAKDAIAQAAAELGGADRLVAWVKEEPSNERIFWGTIYPKLLPLQVNGAGENGEHLIKGITITLVAPDGN